MCSIVVILQLSLTESLCGFSFTMKHLDDRIIHLQSQPGKVSDAFTIIYYYVSVLVSSPLHYC